ncbi:MAG: hypothetical protein PHI16_05615 [Methanocellales archaeon]|nr:hypothetical protein [Methanocellales archaeon]
MEHLALFILLPILPITGMIIGFSLGILGKIPPLKIWVSLLIFTIFIGASAGYTELRNIIMHSRREKTTLSILRKDPNIRIIETRYDGGNGMEIPPNVTAKIESTDSFEKIAQYFDNELTNNGWEREYAKWESQLAWRNGRDEAFLTNKYRLAPTIEFRIDFWGYWINDLFVHNCDDVASDIIRAAGVQLDDRWVPNLTYLYQRDAADESDSWKRIMNLSE